MPKKNFAIDVAFEFVSEDEYPVNQKNLKSLVETAKAHLDHILETNQLDAFNVFDEMDEGA
jgi:hypothetical protein